MSTADPYSTFDVSAYLGEYYDSVDGENDRLLRFHARAQHSVPSGGRMLEFGAGPTVYQLIAAAGRDREIHVVDYLQENLDAVRGWLEGDPDSHDWEPFVERSLSHEGSVEPTERRRQRLRASITHLGRCDAFARPPVDHPHDYDIVAMNFVLEGITSERSAWEQALAAVTALVPTDGHLLMTVITGAAWWRVGDARFPATELSDREIRAQIETLGFDVLLEESAPATITDPADQRFEGYTGIYMVLGRRSCTIDADLPTPPDAP